MTPAQNARAIYSDEVLLGGPRIVDDTAQAEKTPYAVAAKTTLTAGFWPIPVPPGDKWPPPKNTTGSGVGTYPTMKQIDNWITTGRYDGVRVVGNIAVRMPPDIIGIDVDDGYEKDGKWKIGASTLTQLEAEFGPLPPTYSSTARGWCESRIRYYRVPIGWRLKSIPGDSIEIVQHHHRYGVCWPSIHPDGMLYLWYDQGGEALDGPPDAADLTDLPWAWLNGLRSTGTSGSRSVPATPAELQDFYDNACGCCAPQKLKGVRCVLDDTPGARHDRLVIGACMAAREASAGMYPMAEAEAELRDWWQSVMDNPDRVNGTEFDDAIAWAIAQVDVKSERMKQLLAEAEEIRTANNGHRHDGDEQHDDQQHDDDGEHHHDGARQFFKKDIGLLHAKLRTAVEDLGSLEAGPGRSLWRYSNGVWMNDGDDEVRRRVSLLLGERHRRSHAEGIVEDLRSREPFITDDPVTEWINCANGLLDIATGELVTHSPAVPTTYQLATAWRPDALCPGVDEWLDQVAPDDALDLIWEVIGVCIYADMPVHRAVLLVGPGRNGKGTLLRLISKLIGKRHVSAVTLQGLAERFSPASLFGKVANIAGDLDARSITRTDIFKMATGGDVIQAEYKHGQAFTFTNRATMIFSANEVPGSADLSDGFFSRWVIVPFDRLKLEPGQEDPTIETRLHAELEGVLVKAVDGLRRVLSQGGFSQPASVVAANSAYRDNADPLRRFAEEMLQITGNPDQREPRPQVYAAYKQWCETNGNRPLSAARFYDHLEAAFPQVNARQLSGGTRYVTGAWLPSGGNF